MIPKSDRGLEVLLGDRHAWVAVPEGLETWSHARARSRAHVPDFIRNFKERSPYGRRVWWNPEELRVLRDAARNAVPLPEEGVQRDERLIDKSESGRPSAENGTATASVQHGPSSSSGTTSGADAFNKTELEAKGASTARLTEDGVISNEQKWADSADLLDVGSDGRNGAEQQTFIQSQTQTQTQTQSYIRRPSIKAGAGTGTGRLKQREVLEILSRCGFDPQRDDAVDREGLPRIGTISYDPQRGRQIVHKGGNRWVGTKDPSFEVRYATANKPDDDEPSLLAAVQGQAVAQAMQQNAFSAALHSYTDLDLLQVRPAVTELRSGQLTVRNPVLLQMLHRHRSRFQQSQMHNHLAGPSSVWSADPSEHGGFGESARLTRGDTASIASDFKHHIASQRAAEGRGGGGADDASVASSAHSVGSRFHATFLSGSVDSADAAAAGVVVGSSLKRAVTFTADGTPIRGARKPVSAKGMHLTLQQRQQLQQQQQQQTSSPSLQQTVNPGAGSASNPSSPKKVIIGAGVEPAGIQRQSSRSHSWQDSKWGQLKKGVEQVASAAASNPRLGRKVVSAATASSGGGVAGVGGSGSGMGLAGLGSTVSAASTSFHSLRQASIGDDSVGLVRNRRSRSTYAELGVAGESSAASMGDDSADEDSLLLGEGREGGGVGVVGVEGGDDNSEDSDEEMWRSRRLYQAKAPPMPKVVVWPRSPRQHYKLRYGWLPQHMVHNAVNNVYYDLTMQDFRAEAEERRLAVSDFKAEVRRAKPRRVLRERMSTMLTLVPEGGEDVVFGTRVGTHDYDAEGNDETAAGLGGEYSGGVGRGGQDGHGEYKSGRYLEGDDNTLDDLSTLASSVSFTPQPSAVLEPGIPGVPAVPGGAPHFLAGKRGPSKVAGKYFYPDQRGGSDRTGLHGQHAHRQHQQRQAGGGAVGVGGSGSSGHVPAESSISSGGKYYSHFIGGQEEPIDMGQAIEVEEEPSRAGGSVAVPSLSSRTNSGINSPARKHGNRNQRQISFQDADIEYATDSNASSPSRLQQSGKRKQHEQQQQGSTREEWSPLRGPKTSSFFNAARTPPSGSKQQVLLRGAAAGGSSLSISTGSSGDADRVSNDHDTHDDDVGGGNDGNVVKYSMMRSASYRDLSHSGLPSPATRSNDGAGTAVAAGSSPSAAALRRNDSSRFQPPFATASGLQELVRSRSGKQLVGNHYLSPAQRMGKKDAGDCGSPGDGGGGSAAGSESAASSARGQGQGQGAFSLSIQSSSPRMALTGTSATSNANANAAETKGTSRASTPPKGWGQQLNRAGTACTTGTASSTSGRGTTPPAEVGTLGTLYSPATGTITRAHSHISAEDASAEALGAALFGSPSALSRQHSYCSIGGGGGGDAAGFKGGPSRTLLQHQRSSSNLLPRQNSHDDGGDAADSARVQRKGATFSPIRRPGSAEAAASAARVETSPAPKHQPRFKFKPSVFKRAKSESIHPYNWA